MSRTIATALAWLTIVLPAFTLPGASLAGVESIFSVAANQYGTAGDGATVLQQGVYDTRHGVEPLVEPFLDGLLGLNGLAVDADSVFFSVNNRGQAYFADEAPILLEANCGYRYQVGSGTVSPLDDWTVLGIQLGNLDALDRLWDGSIAFSTEAHQQFWLRDEMFRIRQQNVYRFDPLTGEFSLFFDGESLGLADLDAVDVLESGRVVVSTAKNVFILTPRGGMVLRQENAYLMRDAGSPDLQLDGESIGLQTLDAIDVDLMMLAIDEDLVHWSALTTSSGRYDLVRGDLVALWDSGGDYSASTLECLAAGQAEKSVLYPNDPAPGEGFWFVMRETGDTYDIDAPTQVGSRDVGIAASGADCP